MKNAVEIHEKAFISFNVHGLIHLADDVLRYGPLIKFSAFSFEIFHHEGPVFVETFPEIQYKKMWMGKRSMDPVPYNPMGTPGT